MLGIVPGRARAELPKDRLDGVRFEQRLNAQISLDGEFLDENGESVRLGDYFGETSVILALGYYECPMLCDLTLNGLVESLLEISWNEGEQFQVLSVSVDPLEDPDIAAQKRRTYLKRYGRKDAASGWHFLTTAGGAAARLAEEVGFHYVYDEETGEYAHPSGLVVLTPEGKTSRYFFGVHYPSKELLQALERANRNQSGSPVQQFLLMCFQHNPLTGKYGAFILGALRIGAALTFIGLAGAIACSVFRERRPARQGARAERGGKGSGP